MKGRPPNIKRNKQIVKLRNKNPLKYSFAKLGEIFKLKRQTVHEIYLRDNKKYSVRNYPQGKEKKNIKLINELKIAS